MERHPQHPSGTAGQLAQVPADVAVPGAHLLVGGYRQADARGGGEVPPGGQRVARHHEGDDGGARRHLHRKRQGSSRSIGGVQHPARRDPKGSERLPREEASVLPALLLPLQRRDARDFVGDERPDARAAAPQEVLRGHRQTQVRGRRLRHHGDDLGGEGGGALREPHPRRRRERRGGEVAAAGGGRHVRLHPSRHQRGFEILRRQAARRVGAGLARDGGARGDRGQLDHGRDERHHRRHHQAVRGGVHVRFDENRRSRPRRAHLAAAKDARRARRHGRPRARRRGEPGEERGELRDGFRLAGAASQLLGGGSARGAR